jgi:hypothetical protein
MLNGPTMGFDVYISTKDNAVKLLCSVKNVMGCSFIIPAFCAVIDFTKQWIFFAKTGNEVTSPNVEVAKNQHPGRSIADTPYVPLDTVLLEQILFSVETNVLIILE